VLSLFCNRVTVEWLERRSIDPPSSLQVPSWLFCNTGKLVQCSLTAEDFSAAFLLCPIDGSVDVLHEIPVFFDEEQDRSLRMVETSFWQIIWYSDHGMQSLLGIEDIATSIHMIGSRIGHSTWLLYLQCSATCNVQWTPSLGSGIPRKSAMSLLAVPERCPSAIL
jgi:hypothetical protein